jgi:hypothetical protein
MGERGWYLVKINFLKWLCEHDMSLPYISTNDDTLWASIVIENTIYQPHHTSIEHCRMIRFVL